MDKVENIKNEYGFDAVGLNNELIEEIHNRINKRVCSTPYNCPKLYEGRFENIIISINSQVKSKKKMMVLLILYGQRIGRCFILEVKSTKLILWMSSILLTPYILMMNLLGGFLGPQEENGSTRYYTERKYIPRS